MRKRIILLFLAVMVICGMNTVVFAHDVPDLSESGTMELTVAPGSEVTIYRVGDICVDDGNYSFALTESYAQYGLVLDDVRSAELAADLAACAEGGEAKTADEEGHVTFTVDPGLYLMVQTQAGEGNYLFNPFLISMPNYKDGVYTYEVDATPKVGLPPETTEPTEPPETTPGDEKLPQTGQLNWPVPLLAISGLALFAIGWCMCSGKRE